MRVSSCELVVDGPFEELVEQVACPVVVGPAAQRFLQAEPAFAEQLVDAIARNLGSLEERFGFTIDDDEIDGSTFETVGSLVAFVRGKLEAVR